MKVEECYGGKLVKLNAYEGMTADKQGAVGRNARIERIDGKDALIVEEVRGYSWWWAIEGLFAVRKK